MKETSGDVTNPDGARNHLLSTSSSSNRLMSFFIASAPPLTERDGRDSRGPALPPPRTQCWRNLSRREEPLQRAQVLPVNIELRGEGGRARLRPRDARLSKMRRALPWHWQYISHPPSEWRWRWPNDIRNNEQHTGGLETTSRCARNDRRAGLGPRCVVPCTLFLRIVAHGD